MAKPIEPKKVDRYSDAFKVAAGEKGYNHHRPHSGIDYHTPEEYERLVP